MKKKPTRFEVRSLPAPLREKLELASDNTGLSMAAITKLALGEYLGEEETWPDGVETNN